MSRGFELNPDTLKDVELKFMLMTSYEGLRIEPMVFQI